MRTGIAGVLAAAVLLPGAGIAQNTKTDTPSMRESPGSKTPPKPAIPETIDGKTMSQWRAELTHTDASRRSTALMALLHFGEGSTRAVRDVISRLHDPDVSPRAKACLVLRHMAIDGKDVPDVVNALGQRLYPPGSHPTYSESQAIIRYEAARTLQRFVHEAHPVLPALIQGVRDRASWEIRHLCLSILWRASMSDKVGPDPRAVKAMLDALRGGSRTSDQEKLEILQGLAMMGQPADKDVLAREISELHAAAGSDYTPARLKVWAYAGLAANGDAQVARRAMTRIAAQLEHPKLEIRAQAAHALGTLGEKAKAYVPPLLKVIHRDREGLAVHGACLALIRIKDTSPTVVDALLELLHHKDPQHAAAAVKAIVDLKLNQVRVTRSMDKMLEDKDLNDDLRKYIRSALEELNKPEGAKKPEDPKKPVKKT